VDEGIGLKKQRVDGLGFRVRDLEVRGFSCFFFGARVQGLGSTCRV